MAEERKDFVEFKDCPLRCYSGVHPQIEAVWPAEEQYKVWQRMKGTNEVSPVPWDLAYYLGSILVVIRPMSDGWKGIREQGGFARIRLEDYPLVVFYPGGIRDLPKEEAEHMDELLQRQLRGWSLE